MAKMKVTYENITPLMKKINKRRIAATIVAWVFLLLLGFSGGGKSIPVALVIASVIVGLAHLDNLWEKIKVLLFIPVVGWIIWFFIVYIGSVFVGAFMLIYNVVRLIVKTPLISAADADYFIRKEAEQNLDAAVTEAAYNSVMGQQNVQNNNSAESLAKLKEMLDNGLITENEYDVKKAEILSRM